MSDFSENNGAVSGITDSPPQASSGAPPATTVVGSGSALDQINAALGSIGTSLSGAQKAKDQTEGVLGQLQKLFGGAKATETKPTGPSALTVVALVAIALLGAVVVWKFVKARG